MIWCTIEQGECLPVGCGRRSTARVSTGQRVSLNSVEESATEQREGQKYWVYEHLSQVSGACHPCSLAPHCLQGS